MEAKGNIEQAAELIQPLLNQKNGDSEFVYLRYAWLSYRNKKYNQAIQYYRKALKLNKNSIDALLGVSMAMLAQRRWKEAAIYARKVLDTAPMNYTAHIRLMSSESGQRQWSKLEAHAKKIAHAYPTQISPLLFLAYAYDRQGNKQAARQSYARVLLRAPSNHTAKNYLAHH